MEEGCFWPVCLRGHALRDHVLGTIDGTGEKAGVGLCCEEKDVYDMRLKFEETLYQAADIRINCLKIGRYSLQWTVSWKILSASNNVLVPAVPNSQNKQTNR